MGDCKGCGYYTSPRITSEYKDCSLGLTFDQYNICGFGMGDNTVGCLYCFSNQIKVFNPAYHGKFVAKAVDPKDIIAQLSGNKKTPYWESFFQHRFPLHWGGLAEPFCPLEQEKKVGLEILKYCETVQYPIIFSTKGVFQCYDEEYLKIWRSYQKSLNLGWSFSIVTNRDDLAEKVEYGEGYEGYIRYGFLDSA